MKALYWILGAVVVLLVLGYFLAPSSVENTARDDNEGGDLADGGMFAGSGITGGW